MLTSESIGSFGYWNFVFMGVVVVEIELGNVYPPFSYEVLHHGFHHHLHILMLTTLK